MNTKKLLFLHCVLVASLLSSAPLPAECLHSEPRGDNHSTDGSGSSKTGSPGWQVVTKRNFSSQIRLHPHVLVMVAVPWSGEARSVMKEVAHLVINNQQLFGHLKLMVVYRNSEKILADVLDATEGVTLLYYNHSKSFRYRGRLRAQNILSSVSHIMSLHHAELPLKFLNTVEELENFFQSTDKAVLLLEFCGWSAKLLRNMNNRTGESSLFEKGPMHSGDTQGTNLTNEADGTPFVRKENQKGSENEKLTCGIENELSGVPWLGDFSLANETSLGPEARTSNIGTSCTLDRLQQFGLFFSEFNKIAREFFLPPERQRFGVISEKSLLPFLGLGDTEEWLLLIHFSGFPNLSRILEDVNDLRIALQTHHSAVLEVNRDWRNQEGAFPLNGPSVILFLDRSSESPRIREESKSALEVYRQLAQHYQLLKQIPREEGNSHPKISPVQAFRKTQNKRLLGLHGHIGSASRVKEIKDKMAFMMTNQGQSMSLQKAAGDNRDNPAYDILKHLIRQKNSAVKTKEVKVSLLAKEIGFQLLSDDFDVELIDLQPSYQESDLLRPDNENSEHLESNVNVHDDDSADTTNVAAAEDGKQSKLITVRSILQWTPEPILSDEIITSLPSTGSTQEVSTDDIQLDKSRGDDEGIISSKPIELAPLTSHAETDFQLKQNLHGDKEHIEKVPSDHTDCRLNSTCYDEVAYMSTQPSIKEASEEAEITNEKYSTAIGNLKEQQVCHQAFTGSFFFSDGGYRLLASLTGGIKIPSMVILDPDLHQHYVLPKEVDFTFDSLVNFIDKYMNGSLAPYQCSEPVIRNSRENPQPPFVNLDFHEVYGIPRVTADTFSELVLSSSSTHCDSGGRTPSSKDKALFCSSKDDILVFFSNSWCGFCQRMELVVREVYRAFESFKSLLSVDPMDRVSVPLQDKLEGASIHDLPSVYHMDCTLNDCSSFLRQHGKGEVFPSLVLFPAEKKDAISYEGDVSVLGIFEFLANHASNSHSLNEYKGILWNQARKGRGSGEPSNDAFPIIVDDQTPVQEDDEYKDLPVDPAEVRGKDQQPVDVHLLNGYPRDGEQVVVGSVLTATDKLLNVPPFDKSSILIVKADQNEGFQGLILNKHINWDIFEKLDKDLTPLKQAPLSYGGPVRMHDLPLLSLARKVTNGYAKVASDIYFGDPLATAGAIERVRTQNASASDFWFFLGWSSWGWNQLFDEIAEEAWQLSVLDVEHFDWPEI